MKTKLKSLFAIGLFTIASLALAAQVIATGPEAQALFDSLPGSAGREFCTGACFPGQPCDPTCTSFKEGDDYYCARTRHTRSGWIDYTCYARSEEN